MDVDSGTESEAGSRDDSWMWATGAAPPDAAAPPEAAAPPDAAAPPEGAGLPEASAPADTEATASETSYAAADADAYREALAAFEARMATALGQPTAAGTDTGAGAPRLGKADATTQGATTQAAATDTARHLHPTRVALGFAVLAAERLGSPTNGAFAVGVGLAQQTASGLRGLASKVVGPPSRAASRTIDWAARHSGLSNGGPLGRGRKLLGKIVEDAHDRGVATVESGRAEANSFLQASVTDGVAWAQVQAVPQVVDGLVPHLVDSVVPQIVDGIVPHLVSTVVPQLIDGVMPEIRTRVLPVIIDDLTNDPRLRDLVLEQSRDVVGEAAQQLRTASANADDRVEQAFRRLVRGGHNSRESTAEAPAEPSRER